MAYCFFFSWKAAPEMPRYNVHQIQIFLTAYMYYIEAVTKATRIVEENVDIYDTNQTL